MKTRENIALDFEIDKLTNSIENALTGANLKTSILPVEKNDLKVVTKKNGWNFNWKTEYKETEKQVYKLVTIEMPDLIQGLMCIEIKQDHVYMHLLENAPFNRGKEKQYVGVAGNLVAYACKVSFDCGYEGNIAFLSKSQLIAHYEKTLRATHLGGRIMIIETEAALSLMKQYFKS